MSRAKPLFVWVVMSNDFPDKVFSNETLADEYCLANNASDKKLAEDPRNRRQRIYYRWYKFEVTKP